jgi:hypothetical protein
MKASPSARAKVWATESPATVSTSKAESSSRRCETRGIAASSLSGMVTRSSEDAAVSESGRGLGDPGGLASPMVEDRLVDRSLDLHHIGDGAQRAGAAIERRDGLVRRGAHEDAAMRRVGGDQRLAVEAALERCVSRPCAGNPTAPCDRRRRRWSPPSAGRDTEAAFWSSLLSRSSWVRSLASIRSWNPREILDEPLQHSGRILRRAGVGVVEFAH